MTNQFKLLDVVTLLVDLPDYNLQKGQVGTIVELLAGNNAYEVEFSDSHGCTFASLGLTSNQIMLLHFEPVRPNSAIALAVL